MTIAAQRKHRDPWMEMEAHAQALRAKSAAGIVATIDELRAAMAAVQRVIKPE